jgi:hypothetical protein
MNPLVLIRAVVVGAAMLCAASAVFAANEKRRNFSNPAPSSAGSAVPVAAAPANSFEAFGLVVERNIFNPNRTGRSASAPEAKPVRVDEIALVGTMMSDEGLRAFFESADSRFRKTVRVGDSIAEFKVARISSSGVDLAQGDTALALLVAQRLRRVEGGAWTVDTSGTEAAQGTGLTAGRRAVEPGAPAEIPADASDVLKRLMKKREKQLNR